MPEISQVVDLKGFAQRRRQAELEFLATRLTICDEEHEAIRKRVAELAAEAPPAARATPTPETTTGAAAGPPTATRYAKEPTQPKAPPPEPKAPPTPKKPGPKPARKQPRRKPKGPGGVPRGELRKNVAAVLRVEGGPLTVGEIADQLIHIGVAPAGVPRKQLVQRLTVMLSYGDEFEHQGRGIGYALVE